MLCVLETEDAGEFERGLLDFISYEEAGERTRLHLKFSALSAMVMLRQSPGESHRSDGWLACLT